MNECRKYCELVACTYNHNETAEVLRLSGQARSRSQGADIVADLRAEMVRPFVDRLGADFYADSERIGQAVEQRSSFNLIYLPTMFKLDVFLLGRDPRSLRREAAAEVGVSDLLDELLAEAGTVRDA